MIFEYFVYISVFGIRSAAGKSIHKITKNAHHIIKVTIGLNFKTNAGAFFTCS